MDPVVHFEMPYEDQKRLLKFYQTVFSWNVHELGEEMGGYVHAGTTEADESGRPKQAGAINGGFFPKDPKAPAQHPSVGIAVIDHKDYPTGGYGGSEQ